MSIIRAMEDIAVALSHLGFYRACMAAVMGSLLWPFVPLTPALVAVVAVSGKPVYGRYPGQINLGRIPPVRSGFTGSSPPPRDGPRDRRTSSLEDVRPVPGSQSSVRSSQRGLCEGVKQKYMLNQNSLYYV